MSINQNLNPNTTNIHLYRKLSKYSCNTQSKIRAQLKRIAVKSEHEENCLCCWFLKSGSWIMKQSIRFVFGYTRESQDDLEIRSWGDFEFQSN